MADPKVYEKTVVVNSREVDGCGNCRASALLAYLQDASAEHSVLCHCSRKDLLERYHVFWMLTRVWIKLDRPIRWLEELTIRTWHRGGTGVFLYRDYDLFVGTEQVGEAVALWVLPDIESRKMLSFSKTPIPEVQASACGLPPKTKKLSALHVSKEAALSEVRTMRYSETDVNGHINNTKYADFCCDAVPMHCFAENSYLSEIEITYHAECMAGEQVRIATLAQSEGYHIDGTSEDGSVKFCGELRFSECKS